MDSALISDSDPPFQVSAQELRAWDPEDVDGSEFECIGCAVAVYPKAFRPNRKKQAHFSLYENGRHEPGCPLGPPDVAAAEDGGSASDSLRTRVFWPTRLIDQPPERKVRDRSGDLPFAQDQRSSTIGVTSAGSSNNIASRSARACSIRPFASAHLAMTRDQRATAAIDLPTVTDAKAYLYAFKLLRQWSLERMPNPRVFYGQLRWTAELEDDGEIYTIALHAGDGWDSHTRTFARPWILQVDHSDWTPRAHTVFLDELESAVAQARDQKRKPWVFALARQDPTDYAVLEVERRQHIAFIPLDPKDSP
ncbi:hypothetical protein P5V78_24230 [Mycobacteroides abscessus subsp. abscessus]|nr:MULTISPECIES: hypothetical protein [Mycobacteroides]MDO3091104.1 hypothetical protein [Mycobacteroides abscessus subsp. abscessus]OHU15655.1 hypothetical protein BKG75_11220 [Mycobacteroides chelonae]